MHRGYLALVLHAHLPFVRHPEHERFLEETWLFEAVMETYVPLLQMLDGWRRDGIEGRLALTLTPTLCSMLQDPLLQERCARYLNERIDLAEKEIRRTHWERPFRDLARFYHERFKGIRDAYQGWRRDLVGAFRTCQELGQVEIITSAATHALLPLLANHPPSLRAQILVARDQYRGCFGRDPRGIWLPECAYVDGLEAVLQEAGLAWFIVDSHGLLHARPQPRFSLFAPILTPNGIAVFGRDLDSARQVWSREEGYPGDFRYREFYRDIGFDLDFDYIKPYLPATGTRGFTGLKYYRITGSTGSKEVYERKAAILAAEEHAKHFLGERVAQVQRLAPILDRPPLVLAPYDAELFGHWWYEGPEFLDFFVRGAHAEQGVLGLVTPEEYLRLQPTHQVATPAASSWGEEGYWHVWLNEKNEWIYPHLHTAQERMTALARRFLPPDVAQTGLNVPPAGGPARRSGTLVERALKQAGRELLLAQASDWPFILRTGTSPDYARNRVKSHLLRFTELYEQLVAGQVNEARLREIEWQDNLFPEINYRYWA